MTHVHFIAIGGTGMSGIAKVLLEMGHTVSGSDLKASEGTRRLESMGASVFLGHRAENIQGADVVVVSSAVPEDNEELKAAKAQRIPVIHRADMLARLMHGRKGITIAGAHGKTTTTSMIAMVLEKGGLSPTVLVGGEVADFGGNAKLGDGEFLVAEADESDGSFLKLRPHIAVVTNIDDDHLDYYGDVQRIIDAFRQYILATGDNGFRVLCFDDPRVRALAAEVGGGVVSYGTSSDCDYSATGVSLGSWASSYTLIRRGKPAGLVELQIPGRHNVTNSLAAIAVGMEIGLDFDSVRQALADFHGVQRRTETIGVANGVRVLDDYAHHPTEIRTTLKAVRQATSGKVICIFQPHRFSRTFLLQDEFGTAFSQADEIVVLDIYPGPGERPMEGVTSDLLVSSILRHEGRTARHVHDWDEAAEMTARMAMPGDTIITVGAGDVWKLSHTVLKILERGDGAERGHAHPS